MGEKNKKFELFSDEYKLYTLLEAMKNHRKFYLRLERGLKVLGNFDGKYEINLYSEEKDKEIIKSWVSDDDGNILIFNLSTPSKDDVLKITKITNEDEATYDISLAKKFLLNKENIELTRCDKVFGFKFGRLITDLRSFYTMFLNNNLGYQIKGDFNVDIKNELLIGLNGMHNSPKLMEYVNIFEACLKTRKASFNSIDIIAFKDMEIIDQIRVNSEKQKVKM